MGTITINQACDCGSGIDNRPECCGTLCDDGLAALGATMHITIAASSSCSGMWDCKFDGSNACTCCQTWVITGPGTGFFQNFPCIGTFALTRNCGFNSSCRRNQGTPNYAVGPTLTACGGMTIAVDFVSPWAPANPACWQLLVDFSSATATPPFDCSAPLDSTVATATSATCAGGAISITWHDVCFANDFGAVGGNCGSCGLLQVPCCLDATFTL